MSGEGRVAGGWCLAISAGLGTPAAGQQVVFFTDQGRFDSAVQSALQVEKAFWNFEPDNPPAGLITDIPDILDISTHADAPVDPWTDTDGTDLWPPALDNVRFSANLNPGGPYQPHGPAFPEALVYAAVGFNGMSNNALAANYAGDSFDIISGPPAGDNHTAIALELFQLPVGPAAPIYHATVYDKNENELDALVIGGGINETVFVGILLPGGATIGRVDIWDESGGFEGIASIAVYAADESSTCPWDCGSPPNKLIDVSDLLAFLAGFDRTAPVGCDGGQCDFNGDGCQDVTDLLALLALWGAPCPAPPHDECNTLITVDRIQQNQTLVVHFDMYGASASPEPYTCSADPPVHKDIWFCLSNTSGQGKNVIVWCTVDLLLEVNAGCGCPPGALVGCGHGQQGTPPFLMAAGDTVLIRLVNDLDLPNDQLEGDLVIVNTTAQDVTDQGGGRPPQVAGAPRPRSVNRALGD